MPSTLVTAALKTVSSLTGAPYDVDVSGTVHRKWKNPQKDFNERQNPLRFALNSMTVYVSPLAGKLEELSDYGSYGLQCRDFDLFQKI